METAQMHLKQEGELATLAEHQQALLLLLQEFHRVCETLGIRYFLFAGTLLGAVRHKGFIPWDDDLDVLMFREDYERFLREAPTVLNEQSFFLQKEFSEHWPMFFSKLRLNGTACLEKYHPRDPEIHQGVYMDIFPCDNGFSNKIGLLCQFICSKIVIAKGLYAEGYATDSWLKKCFMAACRVLPRSLFHRIVKGPKNAGKWVHCFLGGAKKFSKSVFPVGWFSGREKMEFEGQMFCVPDQYDSLLRALYGDYMQIPPEEDRKCKQHAILVDLKHSHEKYAHYRDGMKFEVHTRSIR